jgi:Domain of unknown function (DUF4188)
MAKIIAGRMTAQVEGDFLVFLIGMRINRVWKIHQWLPVAMAMPRMLRELQQDPTSGYLGAEYCGSESRRPRHLARNILRPGQRFRMHL